MNIFVAKLNFNTTSEDLRTLFEGYGEVDSSKVIIDHDTGKSRGFGFVEMPEEEEGINAINDLNESNFQGNNIVVKKARPRNESHEGGGNYNRKRY